MPTNISIDELPLATCPHCQITKPRLAKVATCETRAATHHSYHWAFYMCSSCALVVSAFANSSNSNIVDHFPKKESVSEDIPGRAKRALEQTKATIHAPEGSIMLAAKAVDEMLKEKGLLNGSLYMRIQEAVTTGLITADMETWAHEVRLDANDQRHADLSADIPTEEDAHKCLKFALAFAEYLFVLPARVQRGIASTEQGPVSP